MKIDIRIVIDNNLPLRLAKELGDFWRSSSPTWKVEHETELPGVKGGTLDKHWISRLAEIDPEARWLIITRDAGRGGKENDKLPFVCKHHGHAFIILNHSLQKTADFKSAISAVWLSLPDVFEACTKLRHLKGCVKLGHHTQGSFILRVHGEPLHNYLKEPSEVATRKHARPIDQLLPLDDQASA